MWVFRCVLLVPLLCVLSGHTLAAGGATDSIAPAFPRVTTSKNVQTSRLSDAVSTVHAYVNYDDSRTLKERSLTMPSTGRGLRDLKQSPNRPPKSKNVQSMKPPAMKSMSKQIKHASMTVMSNRMTGIPIKTMSKRMKSSSMTLMSKQMKGVPVKKMSKRMKGAPMKKMPKRKMKRSPTRKPPKAPSRAMKPPVPTPKRSVPASSPAKRPSPRPPTKPAPLPVPPRKPPLPVPKQMVPAPSPKKPIPPPKPTPLQPKSPIKAPVPAGRPPPRAAPVLAPKKPAPSPKKPIPAPKPTPVQPKSPVKAPVPASRPNPVPVPSPPRATPVLAPKKPAPLHPPIKSPPVATPKQVVPKAAPNSPVAPPVAVPKPVSVPVSPPKAAPAPVSSQTFVLGRLTPAKEGVRLSQGLTAKIIARSGSSISLTSKDAASSSSEIRFHGSPDGAAIFALAGGRYVYVSNSEEDSGRGGAFGVEFDSDGRTLNYKNLLTGTTRNCNGGRTPWNTWISCEETGGGQCWQVDPSGKRSSQKTAIGGNDGGVFEAFAYDARNPSSPSFFVTEDLADGALRRFRPSEKGSLDWSTLHSGGTIDYLQFLPNKTFRWTSSLSTGRQSANDFYKNSEGIAHRNGILKFVSKTQREMFRLDLDKMTYTVTSTSTSGLAGGGRFEAEPDHLLATADGLLYFTEDGGSTPGVFVYDGSNYFALLESDYSGDETTGIAFSPDRKYMFFCIQERGLLFQVSRLDGHSFEGGRVL